MSEFAPPSGPPPPKVPAGWKVVWNEQYSEWFYVNTFTKKSQWEKPTEPIYGPDDEAPPGGPPPTYDPNSARPAPAEKPLGSNNPYAPQPSISEDEALARRLQEEENARAGHPGASSGNRGESDSFYQGGSTYPPQDQSASQGYGGDAGPPQKKGLLGKVFGKSSSRPPQQQGYYGGQQGYPQQQGYPPQGYYGGPPQGGGYYGGGGYPPQQPQPQYYQQPPRRHGGGGIGTGGALALGAGGGLLGGMLLGEAIDGGDDGGGDYGGDGGGDGGGGDGGGGGD